MSDLRGPEPRRFEFGRDTFSFANELIWEYRFDPATGQASTHWNEPRPTYAHHCFVVARSARQFFYHARFDPAQPVAEEARYRRLIREVVSRTPRRPCRPGAEISIPGYDGLRAFSQAHEKTLKGSCGGAWQSYFLRSHWRMVFPVSRRHQARMAEQLVAAFPVRIAPIVHLVRFPQLTINHGIVLFDVAKTAGGLRFLAYDPNVTAHPVELHYDRATRTFNFPRNHYWAGGRVDVIEIFRGGLY
jgi:hypothetical protein